MTFWNRIQLRDPFRHCKTNSNSKLSALIFNNAWQNLLTRRNNYDYCFGNRLIYWNWRKSCLSGTAVEKSSFLNGFLRTWKSRWDQEISYFQEKLKIIFLEEILSKGRSLITILSNSIAPGPPLNFSTTKFMHDPLILC